MKPTVLSLLLLCATIGQISTELLNATVGGSVLIPCSVWYPWTLSWFRWQKDKSPNVLLYWDESHQSLAEKYMNRCHVFETEFKYGNISLRLDDATVEDDQNTFWANAGLYDEQKKVQPERMCELKLQVSVSYQHVDLTVNSAANRATCTARGGYPEPQVSWSGQNESSAAQLDLRDADTTLQHDPVKKTFNVTSSVSVKELKSVTCSIYNPHSHERIDKTFETDAPDENSQQHRHLGTHILIPAVIITIITSIIIIFVCVWLYRGEAYPS